MPRECLRLTKETTYGTFASGNPHIVVDQESNNSWTMRHKNNMWVLRSAGGNNLKTRTGSKTADLAGKFSVAVRPSQTAFYMDLLANLSSGNCPDLPSFTADHLIFLEDGSCTPTGMRYLGCKFGSGSFKMDNSPQGGLLMGDFDVMAKNRVSITTSDFPVPALADYPYAEDPWHKQESVLEIGTTRQDFESLTLEIKNNLKPFRGNGQYISRLKNFGRDPSLTAVLLYASQQDRIDYEAITAKDASLIFTRTYGTDGTKVLTLDFGDVNYFESVEDALNLDDWHRQTVTLGNYLDGAAGHDLVVTYLDTAPTT